MQNIPLTVLWFGGGQDSTALLYLYVHNKEFRERFIGASKFIVVMADTGNEYPETYLHVRKIKEFCIRRNIPFFFLEPKMGFHGPTWQSLQGQMEKNDNIMSVGLPKSCTDNLKVKVCYNFLEAYLKDEYGFTGTRKKAYYLYAEKFGKLRSLIGFAKGEESRCAYSKQTELFPEYNNDKRPVYMQKNIEHIYPLIDMQLDRSACQKLIEGYGYEVPIPLNCMLCPFQNEAEIVYLERFHPKMWAYWCERENAKITKSADVERNLGVKGNKTLPEFLELAQKKYGYWSDEELKEYRNSHGHCVKSKY